MEQPTMLSSSKGLAGCSALVASQDPGHGGYVQGRGRERERARELEKGTRTF